MRRKGSRIEVTRRYPYVGSLYSGPILEARLLRRTGWSFAAYETFVRRKRRACSSFTRYGMIFYGVREFLYPVKDHLVICKRREAGLLRKAGRSFTPYGNSRGPHAKLNRRTRETVGRSEDTGRWPPLHRRTVILWFGSSKPRLLLRVAAEMNSGVVM